MTKDTSTASSKALYQNDDLYITRLGYLRSYDDITELIFSYWLKKISHLRRQSPSRGKEDYTTKRQDH